MTIEIFVFLLCLSLYRPEDVITHLAVSNNQMILAMRNKKLLRIDLMNPDQPVGR